MNVKHDASSAAAGAYVCGLLMIVAASGAHAQSSPGASPSEASTIPAPTPLGERFDLSQGEDPENLLDALASGRVTMRAKLRSWYAKDSDSRPSSANTLGIRLGYVTQRYAGFQAFAEINHVEALSPNEYNDGVNGNFDRTFVGDVEQTELNQAWGQYSQDAANFAFNARVGRQASAAIDERFIGSSGSRQGEQTFDAVAFAAQFGAGRRLSFEYGYIDEVHRLFGDDAFDYESDSHATRVGYQSDRLGTLSAFAVLLDLEDSAPSLSNQTYGISVDKRNVSEDRIGLAYSLGYAYQQDYGSNPIAFSALSLYAEAGASFPQFGIISVGYELSGSDEGQAAFQYSLTTGQRVHRLSDTFITTPDDGLQDYFVNAELPRLPFNTYAELNYHYYTTDNNPRHLAHEANFNMTTPLTENLSLSILGSYFDSEDISVPDLKLLNVEINFRF